MRPPNDDEICEARQALALADPALRAADALTPAFCWRRRDPGFAGLLRLLTEQQISVAAAAAIWGRCQNALESVTPQAVLGQSDAAFREFGFSAVKRDQARALAAAVIAGRIDFDDLERRDDETALTTLQSLEGVGRWTAEVYLMLCEGRRDLFPAKDVALQEALRLAEGGALRPSAPMLAARAAAWRPFRGTAAHLLWAFYVGVKAKVIVLPDAAALRGPRDRLGAVAKIVQ